MTIKLIGNLNKEVVSEYIKARQSGNHNHRGALNVADVAYHSTNGLFMSPKEASHLNRIYTQIVSKKEQFSTSNMPKLPSQRGKTNVKSKDNDELWKKRKKDNPDLINQIDKLGESMKTVITFSSMDSHALSKQWHLIFTIDDKTYNSWAISDIKDGSFTITTEREDRRIRDGDLEHSLVAGVTMKMSTSKMESKESSKGQDIINLLESSTNKKEVVNKLLSVESTSPKNLKKFNKLVDLMVKDMGISNKDAIKILNDNPTIFNKAKSIEESVDKAFTGMKYSLGNKVVTVTSHDDNKVHFNNDKGSPEKPMDKKKFLKSATLWKSKTEAKSGGQEAYQKFFKSALNKFSVSSPSQLKGDQEKKFYDYVDKNWKADNEKKEAQENFEFAIGVAREEYQIAIKVLNRNSIEPVTEFQYNGMSMMGFNMIRKPDADIPQVTPEDMIKLLKANGIDSKSFSYDQITTMDMEVVNPIDPEALDNSSRGTQE